MGISELSLRVEDHSAVNWIDRPGGLAILEEIGELVDDVVRLRVNIFSRWDVSGKSSNLITCLQDREVVVILLVDFILDGSYIDSSCRNSRNHVKCSQHWNLQIDHIWITTWQRRECIRRLVHD